MADPVAPPVLLCVAPYVTEEVMATISGYSVKAIQRKRQEGIWPRGEVWVKAPDDRVLISVEGYRRWVERGST